MAIIINDFEVVTEPPPTPAAQPAAGSAAAGSQPASPAAPSPAPKPLDLRRVAEHQSLRQLRLWAH